MSAHERLLAAVPETTFLPHGIASSQRWSAHFNVACWVRGDAALPTRLALVIRYLDESGERQVTVDCIDCNQPSSMLLAGRSHVPATGRVEAMSAWLLAEPACAVEVDELYVQRVAASVDRSTADA